jgi:hypothetical protein
MPSNQNSYAFTDQSDIQYKPSKPTKAENISNDANMDSVSDSNYTLQSLTINQKTPISEIKQAAIRKFIDSENEENLYILPDGSMIIECIKTSRIKKVSNTAELMFPLKHVMNVKESNHGKVNMMDIPKSS